MYTYMNNIVLLLDRKEKEMHIMADILYQEKTIN